MKKRARPTTNKSGTPVATLQNVTVNNTPLLVRHDSMMGRNYRVAPMVMLVSGVLNGSAGPLFYPPEELAKVPEVWNHKPVVVYHPMINGQGVSACDPTVLTAYSIGVIMNAKFDGTRLVAEAWIDEERANAVDPRIIEALNANRTLELSTGLFTDNEATTGEHNGKPYTAIARNLRPDHLAILPDQIGACSVADGAGFIRNSLSLNVSIDPEVLAMAQNRAVRDLAPYVQINEMSHDSVRTLLHSHVRELYKHLAAADGHVPVWIEDVYDDTFVYEIQGKLYKRGYTNTDTNLSIGDEATEVVRSVDYKPVDAVVGNLDQTKTTNKTTMKKDKIVDALIANAGWSEDDREHLMSKDESFLEALLPVEEEAPIPAAPATPTPAANAEAPKAPVTANEYIANAPADIQEVLRQGMSTYATQKNAVIARITVNASNTFTSEQLQAKSLDELNGIAAFIPAPTMPDNVRNFSGQGGNPGSPTANVEEPLELPVMNFAK